MNKTCALVVLVVAVGCSSSAGDLKAKTAFLKQAEAICTQANTEQDALTSPIALPQIAPYVTRLVAIADQATTKLSALTQPEPDKKQLEAKLFVPLRAQLAAAHTFADKVSAAARTHNQAELTRLLADPPTKTKADLRWMKRYGFSACVKAADTSR